MARLQVRSAAVGAQPAAIAAWRDGKRQDKFLAVAVHPNGGGVQLIKQILRNRDCRADFFNCRLFSDPAWDMLLVLYAMELEQRRISISGLCASSRVPSTTALRWIGVLAKEELIQRRSDPLDGRRSYVELSRDGSAAMRSYFDKCSGNACSL
jgi:DNA-binding MarR family transcriptional regulator